MNLPIGHMRGCQGKQSKSLFSFYWKRESRRDCLVVFWHCCYMPLSSSEKNECCDNHKDRYTSYGDTGDSRTRNRSSGDLRRITRIRCTRQAA
jgi:hypothetical protein